MKDVLFLELQDSPWIMKTTTFTVVCKRQNEYRDGWFHEEVAYFKTITTLLTRSLCSHAREYLRRRFTNVSVYKTDCNLEKTMTLLDEWKSRQIQRLKKMVDLTPYVTSIRSASFFKPTSDLSLNLKNTNYLLNC